MGNLFLKSNHIFEITCLVDQRVEVSQTNLFLLIILTCVWVFACAYLYAFKARRSKKWDNLLHLSRKNSVQLIVHRTRQSTMLGFKWLWSRILIFIHFSRNFSLLKISHSFLEVCNSILYPLNFVKKSLQSCKKNQNI